MNSHPTGIMSGWGMGDRKRIAVKVLRRHKRGLEDIAAREGFR